MPMIPPPFTYVAPQSLPEALSLLQQHGSDAKLMAGGQSLIPLMKFRLASPKYVIDLRKVPGLDTLEERDGHLVIGAMVREAAIEHSPLLQQRYTGLVEASEVVADPIVRNFATLGGNLAHADPANDHPAMMLALRAQSSPPVSRASATSPSMIFWWIPSRPAWHPMRRWWKFASPTRRSTPARPISSWSAKSAITPLQRLARRSRCMGRPARMWGWD